MKVVMKLADLRDSQLTILWMSGKKYSREMTVKQHRHNFYQLQYLLEGNEILTINDKIYTLKPNDIALIDSNISHSYSFEKESKIIDIKFNMIDGLHELMKAIFINSVFHIDDEMIRNRFSQIIDQGVYFQHYKKSNILINIDTQVKLLLLELSQPTVPEPLQLSPKEIKLPFSDSYDSEDAAQILSYMIDNYQYKVSLDMLSEKFHYSKPQIIKLFSDSYNQTPIHILQTIRLQKAKELLTETTKSIGQIANEVGFSNNYFTKVFFKYENQLPSDYRLGNRRKSEEIVMDTSFDITAEP